MGTVLMPLPVTSRAPLTVSILIMQGPQDPEDLDAIYQNGLWPALHDESQIAMVQAHRNAIDIEPWLKVDTGMGRLGVSIESAEQHLASDQLRWRGVMSHLASADALGSSLTDTQADRLKAVIADYSLESSLSNSAGVLAWPSTQRDWARVGIAVYGSHPVIDHTDSTDALRPAMTVQAPLIAVRDMKAGQSIGYSETYRCPEDMSVGYAAVGYADGLPRVLDASASVLIQGVSCPIIGRVSMDSIALDLKGLAQPATLGEPVTLWGPDQRVDRLAESAGTISYELLTGVRGRRIYTD